MNPPEFGTLEPVDLRQGWQSEAGDFTPWLAGEENIALLGRAIGLDLEVEAQEKNVGPFRADVLCKDTANGQWVLVENQLEKTDHTHLGQLMTYASGLQAVTIVWIAARFTEEHRSALDWLNEITDSDFNFFGLEVELWRIGDSPVAPKFNVISKPNDWARSVSGAANRLQYQELTETQKLQLEYWTQLRAVLEERGGLINPTKPMPASWVMFSIGRSDFGLMAYANTRDKRIGVILSLYGPNAKPHFHLLHEQKDALERAFDEPLEWRERPNKRESQVSIDWLNEDPTDKAHWTKQHDWLYDRLQRFHSTFSPVIKTLNADDYVPPSIDEA